MEDPSYRMEHVQTLSGNASAVLFLQFSNDGSFVSSNARDAQVLCWNVKSGKRVTPDFALDTWFSKGSDFHLTMCWPMIGIWNNVSYNTTTSLVAEANEGCTLAAAGTDDGTVKLHRFPAPLQSNESKAYTGHCSKVTQLVWTNDDRVISVGASRADGLLQWKLNTAPTLETLEEQVEMRKQAKRAGASALNSSKEHDEASRARSSSDSRSCRSHHVETQTTQNSRFCISNGYPEPLHRTQGLKSTLLASSTMSSSTQTDGLQCTGTEVSKLGAAQFIDQGSQTDQVLQVTSVTKTVLRASPVRSMESESLPCPPFPFPTQSLLDVASQQGRSVRTSSPARSISPSRLLSPSRSLSPSSRLAAQLACAPGKSRSPSPQRWTSTLPFKFNAQPPPPLRRSLGHSSSATRIRSTQEMLRNSWSPRSLLDPREAGISLQGPFTQKSSSRSQSPLKTEHGGANEGLSPRDLRRPETENETEFEKRSFASPRQQDDSDTSKPQAGQAWMGALQRTRGARTVTGEQTSSFSTMTTSIAGNPSLPTKCEAGKPECAAQLYGPDGLELMRSTVYLYHPPFTLDKAVSYISIEGKAREMFAMPRGWGVLRSQCGLWLWLQLSDDTGLATSVACDAFKTGGGFHGVELRLVLRVPETGMMHQGVEILARPIKQISGSTQLVGNEGLLHASVSPPSQVSRQLNTQLHLELEPDFGSKVKFWLSESVTLPEISLPSSSSFLG
eukprot:gnl/MRDRNA2_/MRDRNA2_33279_c0_seq1.p1 gnl/MRDRNA2_/MRDRNA2_33279_c0~~gnl/MRDRNA2_/MRDRNA2_33279_c0_seq1.p1  ORF type:complete len:801 (+),score=101.38 gnl/MRDRNA2_/MRDRNA2_33279_c0_seq1:215-2404(+)